MVKLIVSVIDGSLSSSTVTVMVSDYPVSATSEDGYTVITLLDVVAKVGAGVYVYVFVPHGD